MKNITRVVMMTVGLSVTATIAFPLSSFAWNQKEFSISGSEAPSFIMVLNEDQFKGKWKQFKGELKKKWGNFTDDDLLYIEGRTDKLEGKIQERYGDRKDEVKKWVDDWFEESRTSKKS